MKQAMLWEPIDGGIAACGLCAHRCRVAPGKAGICGVRVNDNGTLCTRVYGRAIAQHIDPVEKKPLYHFLPSSSTYSVATVGCNFKCAFCQNWGISQTSGLRGADIDGQGGVMQAHSIADHALRSKCRSVSFTYTEPTVFFEYALNTAKFVKDAGLKNIFVSNGYLTGECLQTVAPYLDACNIDLKSFRDDFYKKHCGASLAPVLESLKSIRKLGIWLEVTTLIITGENDTDEELNGIAAFIAEELGKDTPWHVSRFFPQYRMSDRPPTDISSIERAVKIGREAGLLYVYAGNVNFEHGYGQDTVCPGCGETVIRRLGFRSEGGGACKKCGAKISGVFE
jgi:pyruvate formate lyase activating enzyme